MINSSTYGRSGLFGVPQDPRSQYPYNFWISLFPLCYFMKIGQRHKSCLEPFGLKMVHQGSLKKEEY